MDQTPLNDDNIHSHSHSGSSGKRRLRPERNETSSMDVDELVTMISSKLENLDTTDSLDSLIAVFVEVLKCKPEEAAFFLDSAGNDLSTAVSLYLEELSFMQRRRPNNSAAPQHLPPTMLDYDPSFRRYRQMVVPIEGLPEGWEATVCPITGVVLFEHLPTGTKQNQVPPGFADALPITNTASSTSVFVEEGGDTQQLLESKIAEEVEDTASMDGMEDIEELSNQLREYQEEK